MVLEEELLIRKIREGTVIDHIPAGRALKVLSIIGLTGGEGMVIALVMNAPSQKLGRKDLVKIEGRFLAPREVDKIALIAPSATINVIRDYKVASKRKVELPDVIKGLLKCPNPDCVTNQPGEPIDSLFKTISRSPLRLVCQYCGEAVSEEEVMGLLTKG
ncbi:MAG: aspartate carbamoyltransferase regulatory subunit [Aigarchaeota archaeon]|nr:aspartate carbamoyltransferase regulatory subunit [Aigarchaeota archaeon]